MESAETEYTIKWFEMLPLFSSHTEEETLPIYITKDSKSQDLVRKGYRNKFYLEIMLTLVN